MVTSGSLNSPAVRTLLTEARLAGDWVLDPSRSKVELHTRHMWGLRPVEGVFREVSGLGAVSPAGEVTAASIDTKNKKRDDHLRSDDFSMSATTLTSPSRSSVPRRTPTP